MEALSITCFVLAIDDINANIVGIECTWTQHRQSVQPSRPPISSRMANLVMNNNHQFIQTLALPQQQHETNRFVHVSLLRQPVRWARTMTKSHKERRHNEIGPHKIDDVSQRRTYPNFATEKIEENKLKISKYFLFFLFLYTSLKGLILVCMINGNLHSSHEFVSDAVSHCCRHVWWTNLRLPEQ